MQATAGLLADGRHLAKRARDEAQNLRDQYKAPPTLEVSIYPSIMDSDAPELLFRRLWRIAWDFMYKRIHYIHQSDPLASALS